MQTTNSNSVPTGRRDQNTHPENKGLLALYDKLDRLMAKNKPTKRDQTAAIFRELYPKLEAYLAQGQPLKAVLAAFNELTQSKVCTRTFNDLLAEERARRDANGDPVCCSGCSRPFQTAHKAEAIEVARTAQIDIAADVAPTTTKE